MKVLAIVLALVGSMLAVNTAEATGRRMRLRQRNNRAQVVVNVNDNNQHRNNVQEIRVLRVENYQPSNRVEIRVR